MLLWARHMLKYSKILLHKQTARSNKLAATKCRPIFHYYWWTASTKPILLFFPHRLNCLRTFTFSQITHHVSFYCSWILNTLFIRPNGWWFTLTFFLQMSHLMPDNVKSHRNCVRYNKVVNMLILPFNMYLCFQNISSYEIKLCFVHFRTFIST